MLVTDLPNLAQSHNSAADAVAHAIGYLETVLGKRWKRIDVDSETYNILRRDCPYVIQETTSEGTFILMNRNYKPLGSNLETGSPRVKYENYPNLHVRLTPDQIKWVTGHPSASYLFGEQVNPPWASRADAEKYLAKLRELYGMLAEELSTSVSLRFLSNKSAHH